jgi:hypothetical protein
MAGMMLVVVLVWRFNVPRPAGMRPAIADTWPDGSA